MIRNILKKAAIILTAVSMTTMLFGVRADAKNDNNDTIRVGLYYKGSSVNTAQSVIDVSAQSGLQIGFTKNGSFELMYSHTASSALYIRKDSYYYNTGSGLKEFSPSSSNVTGKKYGPYHIKIGSDYPDSASAAGQVLIYRQAGINAFIAYNDAWQVWTGNFVEETEASNAVTELSSIVGPVQYDIIKPSSDRIAVVDDKFETICIFSGTSAYFQVRPAPENEIPVISVKGSKYRGSIEVRRLSGSDMTVINVVSLREYLYGNVPPEIGGKSPAEALKAQAVVSKMYAVNNKGKHAGTGFDICATTHCQVYKGYSVEVAECNKAIDMVYDKVITYNGEPIKHAYYFASGGGSTEDVRNVWGSSYPYLVSVSDEYEKIYTWTKTLRASDVKAMLPEVGNVLGITITKTAPTGRVTQLAVSGTSRGEPLYFSNEKCRTLFGLNSQLYTITTDADIYVAGLSYDTKKEVAATQADTENISRTIAVQANADKNIRSDVPAAENAADVNESAAAAAETHAVSSPNAAKPSKTQLGGMKVITANGVSSVKGVNNKVTIMGAEGVVSTATVVPETYTFTGRGWGHAVGMSQEGAIGMAKAGFKYDEILKHYFQGTEVK